MPKNEYKAWIAIQILTCLIPIRDYYFAVLICYNLLFIQFSKNTL